MRRGPPGWALPGATWKFVAAMWPTSPAGHAFWTSPPPNTTLSTSSAAVRPRGAIRFPTFPILRAPGTPSNVRGGSYATLDNLVVGFRPASDAPSPVMPLAIRRDAWASERDTDSNANGIREMILRLQAARSPQEQRLPPQSNAAVLFYRGSADPPRWRRR